MLSTYLVCPRFGYMHQALHVFKYLKDRKRSKYVYDPTCVNINDNLLLYEDRTVVKAKCMSELHPDTVEEKPTNAPKLRGIKVQITCFVYTDYGVEQITRRSRTGILIYIYIYISIDP